MAAQTLYERLWNSHVVSDYGDGVALLYIDRQLLHEVSSPQAFAGLERRRLPVRRPTSHLSVADHAVPTRNRDLTQAEPLARSQIELLTKNSGRYGIECLALSDQRQGIVHVVGPEQGVTLPGITLVCGDSHTSTHGAFGTLAFGIGASECECVLATQTLRQKQARNFSVLLEGELGPWISAKDVALAVISVIGAAGATGCAIEYRGGAIINMSMAARMTLCNMSIEAGARTGLVAPDDTTFASLEGRPRAPRGAHWERALDYWRTLNTDPGAPFQRETTVDLTNLAPQVTWGTSPDQVLSITGTTPDPDDAPDDASRARITKSLAYMGLAPGKALQEIPIDNVFIGSCTNSRIEDLRAAAQVVAGKHVARGVHAIVVPGSGLVKARAELEGLDRIFIEAGFEWRFAGCSLCVAMNDDKVAPGQRCASTSNRNFEGRQGVGARTHLMSPVMAAAAALTGHLVDVRELAS